MGNMKTTLVASDPLYPFYIVLVTLVLFWVHFMFGSERFFRKGTHRMLAAGSALKRQAFAVFYKRVSAFFLFGVCPIIIIKILLRDSIANFGLSRGYGKLPFAFITPVLVLTFLNMLFFSRRRKIYSRYPEIRGARVSRFYFVMSAITYSMYLYGYECLFRGFLLFGLRKPIGDLPAAVVSMTFVTLAHLGTSLPVILGSMISGIIFPYISLLSGSIWYVFLLHVFIGVGMDYLCVKYRIKIASLPLAVSDEPFMQTDR
jgi:membrane protease YdiL (CAAX protease family)